MKKVWIKVALVSAALFGFSTAHAGFLVEPYAGFMLNGSSKVAGTKNDYSGSAFGARLGMTTFGLMYGIDYGLGAYTISDKTSADTKVDATDAGVFVGYEFPILLRAWVTYDLSSQAKGKNSGYETTYKGKGLKVGVGYTGFPLVAINLEMFNNTYDKCTTNISVSTDCRTDAMGGSDVTTTGYLLSLSLPLP